MLEIEGLDIFSSKEGMITIIFIGSSQQGGYSQNGSYNTTRTCPSNDIEIVCKSCILTIQILPQGYTNYIVCAFVLWLCNCSGRANNFS